jgi:hypothetical protein
VRRVGVLIALAGCGSGAAGGAFAVGWRGPLPSWNGPCDVATLRPAGILDQPAPGSFVARRPGVAEVRCRDGKLRLDVRQPDRIFIDRIGPLRAGAVYILTARLAAAGDTLELGDAKVDWTLPPQLRDAGRCYHMSGRCLSGSEVRVVAYSGGAAPVTVRYGALTATATIRIE